MHMNIKGIDVVLTKFKKMIEELIYTFLYSMSTQFQHYDAYVWIEIGGD